MKQNDDLQQRNRDLEILTRITQAIHNSQDLDYIYNTALDEIMRLDNVDMAGIYMVDEKTREAVLTAHRNLPQFYVDGAGRIPYGKGVTWQVLNSGEVTNIEDIQSDPNIGPLGKKIDHHSVLFIPIHLGDEVIGTIAFCSYRKLKYGDRQVNLLTSVGDQIAIAISRATLRERLLKQNRYKSIVNVINESVHSSIDLQTVMDNAIAAMENNIPFADNILMYMVEDDCAVLKSYNRNLDTKYLQKVPRIPYPKGATWKTIIDKEPIYVPDVDKDDTIGPAGRELGIKSYLSVPIEHDARGIGCIHITTNRRYSFGREEIDLLKDISRQIETAINNARNAEVLRQSEERYRTLFEQSPSGVYIFDKDLIITQCNERLAKIFNTTREKIVGLKMDDLEDRTFIEGTRQVLNGRSYYKKEALYRTTVSGIELWLSIQISPLYDSRGNVTGGMALVEDITEKKKTEERLLQSQRLESIGTLAGGIAHNLNNVLQPILLSLHHLKSEIRDDKSVKMIEILEDSANRGKHLVNQVLSFARGSSGEYGELDLSALLKEIKKLLDETFPKKVDIRLEIDEGEYGITGDVTKIHQVIMNVCMNARDAMPEGGTIIISASPKMIHDPGEEDWTEPGNYIVIEIEDEGYGIPRENRNKIFDPFFTTKQPGEGTGLGLSTSYSIIREHRGFITVRSEEGKGSCFSIHIPAVKQPLSVTERSAEVTIDYKKGNGELILVVDDERSVLDLTKIALENNDYRALVSSDGAEAIALYVQNKDEVAAVIIDLMMPRMYGPSIVAALRKINPDIRIIGSTGAYGSSSGLAKVNESDLDAVIRKPYTTSDLLFIIQDVIVGKPSELTEK